MSLRRVIPLNIRTVLYTFCCGGALSLPLGYLFQTLWPRDLPEFCGIIPIIALFEVLALPFVSLSLIRVDHVLCLGGIFLFLLLFFSSLLFPAVQ